MKINLFAAIASAEKYKNEKFFENKENEV